MIPPDSLEAADILIRKPLKEAVKMNKRKNTAELLKQGPAVLLFSHRDICI